MMTSVVVLVQHIPEETTVQLLLPFQYLLASSSLNLFSILIFVLIVLFGENPGFSNKAKSVMIALVFLSFILFFGGLAFSFLEGWPYGEAVMFCLVTVTSIGYGNLSPTTTTTKLIVIAYGIVGLGFLGLAIEKFRFSPSTLFPFHHPSLTNLCISLQEPPG